MQFELNFFDIAGHVLVVVGLDIDGPVVSVSVGFALFPKILRNISVHDRLQNGCAPDSDGFRRDRFVDHF